MNPPLTAAEVLDLSKSVYAAADYSPLGSQSFLLFDTAACRLSPAQTMEVNAWLQALTCPVLALGDGAAALAQAADVALADPEDAAPLVDNIRRHPQAAAALVQLLRVTGPMPLADALATESLTYSCLQSGPEFRAWLQDERPTAPPPPREEGPAVVMERRGDELQLELNRPAHRNAMSVEMRDALVEALQLVVSDPSISQVQLSGRGKCFSTGGDLSEFGTLPDPASAHFVRALALPGRYLAQCAERVQVRVHGACIGSGIEFPAFAARVIASEDAYFQLPELRFGLIPGAGGCISIARRIGRQRTGWMVLSGKRINAQRALEWGLVDAVEAA